MMASSQHPKVAVVILNWNGIEHLKTYLPSVLEHTPSEMWPFGSLTTGARMTVWTG